MRQGVIKADSFQRLFRMSLFWLTKHVSPVIFFLFRRRLAVSERNLEKTRKIPRGQNKRDFRKENQRETE